MKPLQPLGCIDILVCNASILRIGKFLDLDDKDYQDTMNVNILGYIYVSFNNAKFCSV